MPYLIRPNGDTNQANWQIVNDATTPFEVGGLAADDWQVAGSVWSSAITVTSPPVTEEPASTLFTLTSVATGGAPYFLDTASLPDLTSRIEYYAELTLPALPAGAALYRIFYGESNSADLILGSNGWTMSVKDSAGTAMIAGGTLRSTVLPAINTPIAIYYDVNFGTQSAKLYVNDVKLADVAFASAGSGKHSTLRKFGYLATASGGNAVPAGTQVEYLDMFLTTNGVRTHRTNALVEGPASVANAHPWKRPTDGTGNAT